MPEPPKHILASCQDERLSVDKNDTKINVNLDCCHKWLLAFVKMLGCYRVSHSNLASYYINNPFGVLKAC